MAWVVDILNDHASFAIGATAARSDLSPRGTQAPPNLTMHPAAAYPDLLKALMPPLAR